MPPSNDSREPGQVAFYGVVFTLLNIIVLGCLYIGASHAGRQQTFALTEETVSFLEGSVDRFENYEQGATAQRLRLLTSDAQTFATFLPQEHVGLDDGLLDEFVATEHLGGLVVADAQGHILASAAASGEVDAEFWGHELAESGSLDIVAHSQKTFSDVAQLGNAAYAYAVVSYGDDLLLAYRELSAESVDPYGYTIQGLLASNSFHKNPTVFIAQDGKVVSTNDERGVLDNAKYSELLSQKIVWSTKKLVHIDYDDQGWYALRSSYKDYVFYILYPESEVFSDRKIIVTIGIIVYLAASVAVLVVRALGSRKALRSTRKQLSIINAISATYESTALLHLDTMAIEVIKLSGPTGKVFAAHPEAEDFVKNAVYDLVAPESRERVLELLDVPTLRQRLEGMASLSVDVKATDESTWYSLQVIPQQRDKDGNLLAVIVATRDITAVKRAEELSFRDKLTGLRNRNYLESHVEDFVVEANLPLSIVMADCNYLKRTNDTMGRKWGDELLRRVSEALKDAAGRDDAVMRIGGDEFLIVCPRAGRAKVDDLVSRAKKRLELASDADLTLSVSFGSSTSGVDACSFEEVYAAADQAMYEEKAKAHRAS